MTLFYLRKSTYLFLFLLMNFQLISCANQVQEPTIKILNSKKQELTIKTGAENTNLYLNLLKGKNIAIVANQTSVLSVVEKKEVSKSVENPKEIMYHLVDFLNNDKSFTVKKVFSPEHGFRGKADASEIIRDGIDVKTSLPIISLYGKSKKPSKKDLKDIDIVLFDIQDVGVRFYTYISTLHYVMEACAENNIQVIILDRPNPNVRKLRF